MKLIRHNRKATEIFRGELRNCGQTVDSNAYAPKIEIRSEDNLRYELILTQLEMKQIVEFFLRNGIGR